MEQIIPSNYLQKIQMKFANWLDQFWSNKNFHWTSSKKYPESSNMHPLECLNAKASSAPYNNQR